MPDKELLVPDENQALPGDDISGAPEEIEVPVDESQALPGDDVSGPLEEVTPTAPATRSNLKTENMFDGPIPGQSLTQSPGSAPSDSPPQYAAVDDAAEATWRVMRDPRRGRKIVAMLKKGAPVEALVNSMTQAGFNEGKWTPDVAELLKPILAYQMIAVAKANGLDDFDITFPDRKTAEFEVRMDGIPDKFKSRAEKSRDETVAKAKASINASSTEDTQNEDNKPFSNGILGV